MTSKQASKGNGFEGEWRAKENRMKKRHLVFSLLLVVAAVLIFVAPIGPLPCFFYRLRGHGDGTDMA